MEKTPSRCCDFPEMLTILFIGLKLTGHIDWSLIWVLSPLWVPEMIQMVVIRLYVLADWMAKKVRNFRRRLKNKAYQRKWRFPTDLPISK